MKRLESGSCCQKETRVHLLLSTYPCYLFLPIVLWWSNRRRLSIAIFVALFLFFRNPDRLSSFASIPETTLTSPADGRVMRVSRDGDRWRIAIFLSIMDVHVQYAPADGRVIDQRYKQGEFHPAYILEKSNYNERMETDLKLHDGSIVTIVQIAGQLANRIDSFVSVGCPVTRGCRLGLIKFGSRVDLLVPKSAFSPQVVEGERVVAGRSVLFVANENTV